MLDFIKTAMFVKLQLLYKKSQCEKTEDDIIKLVASYAAADR